MLIKLEKLNKLRGVLNKLNILESEIIKVEQAKCVEQVLKVEQIRKEKLNKFWKLNKFGKLYKFGKVKQVLESWIN